MGPEQDLFLQTIINNQKEIFSRLLAAEEKHIRGENIARDVEGLKDAVLGNGEPGLKEKVRAQSALVTEVRTDLYGEKNDGLLGRFRELEQSIKVNWAWVVAIGVILSPVVTLLLLKLVTMISPGLKD